MKLIAALLLVAASVSTAAADNGSSSSDPAGMAQSDCARARKLHKTCQLTFGAEEVNGKLVSPDGTDASARGDTKFSSLIRYRYDFRAEIIKAAEDF